MAVPGHPAIDHEADDPPFRSALLGRCDHVSSDEVLVQLRRPAQAGLDRTGRLVDVVPIEREARLKAQGVARPEPDRDDARGRAGGHEAGPDLDGSVVVDEDLEAVLAGVSGPGHDRTRVRDARAHDAERRQRFDGLLADLKVCHGREDRRRPRTLDGDERHLAGTILEADAGGEVRSNVRAILLDVRGVDHHEVFIIGQPVDDHIVDDRSALVRQEAIARLADGEAGDIARDQPVNGGAGTRAGEEEFAHVGEIEQARVLPDRAMLGDDAGRVLDRHFVAGEVDHLPASADVLVEERRAVHRALAPRARSSTSR